MSGFTAADAVVALDWDFHPYIEVKGTVPEPSQAKLDAYARALRGAIRAMGLDLPATSSEEEFDAALSSAFAEGKLLTEALEGVEEAKAEVRKVRIKAASAVCTGKPTVEQITRLPPRVREAFLGWVAGWAMDEDPTQPQPATNASRAMSANGAHATS